MSDTHQRNPPPRPPSSVYSEYIPGNFDRNNLPPTLYESSSPPLILNMSRHYRTRPHVPFTHATHPSLSTRVPPSIPSRQKRSQIRDHAQLLRPPIAQQYATRTFQDASTSTTELPIPTPPVLRPLTRRAQGPRGIVRASTETRELAGGVDLYWNHELQEWRPIPGIKTDDPSDDSESDGSRRRRSKLKKRLKGILQVLKDLGNPADKKDKDDRERRRALRRSISGPVV